MGNVDDEYASSMLTSPGRLIVVVGAAGAENAPTEEGVVTTRAVNRVVAVRMVFMVVLTLMLSELCDGNYEVACSSSLLSLTTLVSQRERGEWPDKASVLLIYFFTQVICQKSPPTPHSL